jgi:hypothetical protein
MKTLSRVKIVVMQKDKIRIWFQYVENLRIRKMVCSTEQSVSIVGYCLETKMAVLWVVAPCSLVEVYQRFRGPYCPHHQGDSLMMEAARTPTSLHGATTQKTAILYSPP